MVDPTSHWTFIIQSSFPTTRVLECAVCVEQILRVCVWLGVCCLRNKTVTIGCMTFRPVFPCQLFPNGNNWSCVFHTTLSFVNSPLWPGRGITQPSNTTFAESIVWVEAYYNKNKWAFVLDAMEISRNCKQRGQIRDLASAHFGAAYHKRGLCAAMGNCNWGAENVKWEGKGIYMESVLQDSLETKIILTDGAFV